MKQAIKITYSLDNLIKVKQITPNHLKSFLTDFFKGAQVLDLKLKSIKSIEL